MDRNSRPAFAALSADEERRRANEEDARERDLSAEDVEFARPIGDQRPNRTSRIFGRIRRALGRA
jgi:hypothetical protein